MAYFYLQPVLAVFLLSALYGLDAKTVSSNALLSETVGHLSSLESDGGQRRRLHRRDIEAIKENETHHLRLHMENGEPPLDLHLKQGSVWGADSQIVVRKGKHTFRVPHHLGRGCNMRGQIKSPEKGAVILNRCGKMTGRIHVSGHKYELEEITEPGREGADVPLSHTKFRVTKKKSDQPLVRATDLEVLQLEKRSVRHNDNSTATTEAPSGRTKRETRSAITVEMVAYLDANYVRFLREEEGMTTDLQMRTWVTDKWDLVQEVLSDPEEVGLELTIRLKKVVIMEENMEGYPGDDVLGSPRLQWFCENTELTNHFDAKVLYTINVAGRESGLAYIGGMCREDRNCFHVKSLNEGIRIEIHEFGHSLGFPHDPNFPDDNQCGTPGGFMGWDYTYRYLPCYRRLLRSEMSLPKYSCLDEEIAVDEIAYPNYYDYDYECN